MTRRKNACRLATAAILGASLLWSCGSKNSGPSPLEAQADRISLELAEDVDSSPMFLSAASASYSEGKLTYSFTFCDSIIHVKDYSEALVQFYVAQELKKNPGKNLDEILNTLSKEQGSLEITLSDVYGDSRTYSISSSRLKQLFKQSPMQLGFQEVKANVLEILASSAMEYRNRADATDATFALSNGFATYTLTFPKATAYGHMSQGSLMGRYLTILKPRYEAFGSYRESIEELMRSLQIDGYRFVYTTPDDKKPLKTTIPWRDI